MRQTWTDGVCLSELCRLWMRHSCWGWSQEIMGQVVKSDSGWGEKSDFIRLKRRRKFQNREQRGKKPKKLNILIKLVIFVIFCNIIYFCFLIFFC